MRPESGPMQFGKDWPGLFIRGDNAGGYAHVLQLVLRKWSYGELPDRITMKLVRNLHDALASCDVRNIENCPLQVMKPIEQCLDYIDPASGRGKSNDL